MNTEEKIKGIILRSALITDERLDNVFKEIQSILTSEIREAKIKMLEELKKELVEFNSIFAGTPEAKDVIEAIIIDYTKGISELQEQRKGKPCQ